MNNVTFSPDGQWVATASDDGSARIFDPATGTERSRLTHDGWVNWVAFSPDGQWVATASDDGSARIFDPATGTERSRLPHPAAVNAVVFTPDGQWVATACDDGSARISPIATQVLIAVARDRMTRPLNSDERQRYVVSDLDALHGHDVNISQRANPRKEAPFSKKKHVASKAVETLQTRGGDLLLNWYRMADFTVLEVSGEIDVYTAPRLREQFIFLVNSGHYHIVVNMETAAFLDSTGLGVLVGASEEGSRT